MYITISNIIKYILILPQATFVNICRHCEILLAFAEPFHSSLIIFNYFPYFVIRFSEGVLFLLILNWNKKVSQVLHMLKKQHHPVCHLLCIWQQNLDLPKSPPPWLREKFLLPVSLPCDCPPRPGPCQVFPPPRPWDIEPLVALTSCCALRLSVNI